MPACRNHIVHHAGAFTHFPTPALGSCENVQASQPVAPSSEAGTASAVALPLPLMFALLQSGLLPGMGPNSIVLLSAVVAQGVVLCTCWKQ
jgi:hypothetical protein